MKPPISKPHAKHRTPPLAADLFSGCGGTTTGLKAAGFAVIAAVDNDPLANESFATNHPDVQVWAHDLLCLDPSQLRQHLGLRKGGLDLLAACPPCQGFSRVRTLNGLRTVDDPAKRLVRRFLAFAAELLPKAILFENVPGLSADSRFAALIRGLRSLRYECNFAILDAADYGVPQRRKRLLLIASRVGEIQFAEPLTLRSSVRSAIANLPLPGRSGDPLHDIIAVHSPRISRLIKSIPKDGGSRATLPRSRQLPCHQFTNGFHDVYGRMAWDDVSPTITGGCLNPSKGRFLHPAADRAITLREAALLQTLPPNYFISLSRGKYAAARLIGNALPPNFVAAHASRVIEKLS